MIHPLPIDLLFKPNIHDDDAFLYIVSRKVKTGKLIGKMKQEADINMESPYVAIGAANAQLRRRTNTRMVVIPRCNAFIYYSPIIYNIALMISVSLALPDKQMYIFLLYQ